MLLHPEAPNAELEEESSLGIQYRSRLMDKASEETKFNWFSPLEPIGSPERQPISDRALKGALTFHLKDQKQVRGKL